MYIDRYPLYLERVVVAVAQFEHEGGDGEGGALLRLGRGLRDGLADLLAGPLVALDRVEDALGLEQHALHLLEHLALALRGGRVLEVEEHLVALRGAARRLVARQQTQQLPHGGCDRSSRDARSTPNTRHPPSCRFTARRPSPHWCQLAHVRQH